MSNHAPFRILIVDDIEVNRDLLARRLERKGHLTTQAEDGNAALRLIAEQEFDVVLLDIMMPGISGIEVLKHIRLGRSPDELPVIMVTAKAATTDIVEALGLGANDYITKPIEFSVAFARLETQLNRKRTRQALDKSLKELETTNHQLRVQIEERERANKLVSHLKNHDPLTSLSNRARVCDELSRQLAQMTRSDGALAVVLLDLDGFTLINSAFGRAFGDKLLVTVAQRLRNCLREVDQAGRIGGDEFCVLATVDGVGQAIQISDRIASALSQPYMIDDREITISVCTGVAMAPYDGNEADQLLDNAQFALSRARSEGRGRRCFFEIGMDAQAKARRLLELDLQIAISSGELEVFYQPIVNLSSGALTGAEALLRWQHPQRGLVSPAEFIPLAEETGLIVPLGNWVLHQACKEAAGWPSELKVAVNISAVQLRNDQLTEEVMRALSLSKLDANRLDLEITETVLLAEATRTVQSLHQLRRAGIRVSLDDFGTGFSSLSYLRTFPFDKIKIDRSFVQEIGAVRNTTVIVEALIGLSKGLNATVNAEGVETQAQFDWLRSAGCTEMQGYLVSRPLPACEFRSFVGLGRARYVA